MSIQIKPDGSTNGFPAEDVEFHMLVAKDGLAPFYDLGQDPDVQTDKKMVKLCPCTACKRPVVVNVFYAAAQARCIACKGVADSAAGKGSAPIVQAGRTDPAIAKDLAACLINRTEFEIVTCPFGHGDMELKSVSHNEHYGPSKLIGYSSKGQAEYKQVAAGETTMHQCNECKCVITMSTTAQQVFARQNEPREGKNSNIWASVNGVREEEAA